MPRRYTGLPDHRLEGWDKQLDNRGQSLRVRDLPAAGLQHMRFGLGHHVVEKLLATESHPVVNSHKK